MNKVYLVGAGLGSIDLYTQKALRLIKKADVLVYDSLIDINNIIPLCKKEAELICVGKRKDKHLFKQAQINALLVEKAKSNKLVVRLKGGDIFVFARGSEEAKYLFENNIYFEVVPGLSSAIAACDKAGIPITHRGLVKGFMVFTASFDKSDVDNLDYSLMLSEKYSYIILMGLSKLENIVSGLIKAGKNPKSKIAIISNASYANQRVLISDLENIVARQEKAKLTAPAIIVISETIVLNDYINYFKKYPKKQLLVVSYDDNSIKDSFIDENEYVVDNLNVAKIVYKELNELRIKGNILFTSKHAVKAYFENFKRLYHDYRLLKEASFIVIGEKTKEILKDYGFKADFMPSEANCKTLFNELDLDDIIWYTSKDSADNTDYQKHIIYESIINDFNIIDKNYDYAFFTSKKAYELFKEKFKGKIKTYITIGPRTSQAIIDDLGDNIDIIESDKASKESMLIAFKRREKECFIEVED